MTHESVMGLNYSTSECPAETLNTGFEVKACDVGALTLLLQSGAHILLGQYLEAAALLWWPFGIVLC